MAAPGRIRIIGGRLRGLRLPVPALPGLRPTPDRLRETLFNWLAPRLAGAAVLDLFAGTGVLALEALSRGAALALAVERDPRLCRALAAHAWRFPAGALEVRQGDALRLLAGPPPRSFDLVFVDPPFAAGLWEPVTQRLEAGGWLAPEALIYLETPPGAAPSLPAGWVPERESRAGQARGLLARRLSAPRRDGP
ncbi:MAG: 16S rRNA (guanine(966)-N(2))-methyltransferase RsmD [Xanthomonadales bacterium]|nr:16S rRNA (guanine(966)-N(2))-methyltransferase RsmD [Xanthomonadales bacterium]